MKRPRDERSLPLQIWRYHSKRRGVVTHAPRGRSPREQGTPPTNDYTLRDLLTVLFKRKRLIGTFFVAGMATVVIGVLLKRPEYEATAAILVKPTRAEVPVTAAATDPVVLRVSEEDLNSEVEILRSRSLVEGTLQRLIESTDESPGLIAGAKGLVKRAIGRPVLTPFEQEVVELERRLSFSLIPRSNIVEIAYRSPDPSWAANVLDVLIDEYMKYRVRVYQSGQAAEFFDEQAQTAGQQLTEAEDALQRFTREAGLAVSHEEQRQLALRKLDEFERAMADAYVDVQRNSNQVAALEQRLREVPERLPTAYRLNQDPETEQLNTNLVELRLERDGLLTRGYSPTNVRVRDLDAQIQLAEERLEEAEARLGGINRTEINEVHQALKSELLTAQAELEGARARHEALESQVESFRRELSNLNEKSFDLTRLIREVTATEQAYMLYRQKRDEAQVSQAMDQQSMVNVSIAREPRRPLKPTGLSLVGLLVSAFVLISIGSVGVGFAREFMDHTFTTGDDLERRLGIAHLASIPQVRVAGGTDVARLESGV